MKNFLLILGVLLTSCLKSTESDQRLLSDIIDIPDVGLEQYLIDIGYDDILDGTISAKSIEGITEIVITDEKYNIIDIDVLSEIPNLSKVIVRNNRLVSVSLETPNLIYLDVSSNPLIKLDIPFGVESLIISDTDVSTLTGDLSELKYLNANGTRLTSFDFSKSPLMSVISLTDSPISNIKFNNNANVGEVFLYKNPNLTEIELSNLPNMTKLVIFDSNLTSLDITANGNIVELETTNSPNLTCIVVSNDQLSNYTENWDDRDGKLFVIKDTHTTLNTTCN